MTQLSIDSETAGTDTLTLARPVTPGGAMRTTPSGVEPRSTHQHGIHAVLVERDDGTCALYGGGQSGTWPSISDARAAFEEAAPHLVWRETTPGVWVARADANTAPARDGRSWSNRRSGSVAPRNGPSGTDTYMTARVLRGITRTGGSHPEDAVAAS
jgi:hypothetical protein